MARTPRKVLLEIESLDGRKLRVDYDQYGYACAELVTVKSGARAGAQDWRILPASYCGTVGSVLKRLLREGLQSMDGLQLGALITNMNDWGERLETAALRIGDPKNAERNDPAQDLQ